MNNIINKNINKNRHRKIISSKLIFFRFNRQTFKKNNPLSKIINRNNVKTSYSCTNNISRIIYNHNKKFIDKLYRNNYDKLKQFCNCKIKNECLQGNKCNLNDIIYQVNISTKETNTNEKAQHRYYQLKLEI